MKQRVAGPSYTETKDTNVELFNSIQHKLMNTQYKQSRRPFRHNKGIKRYPNKMLLHSASILKNLARERVPTNTPGGPGSRDDLLVSAALGTYLIIVWNRLIVPAIAGKTIVHN